MGFNILKNIDEDQFLRKLLSKKKMRPFRRCLICGEDMLLTQIYSQSAEIACEDHYISIAVTISNERLSGASAHPDIIRFWDDKLYTYITCHIDTNLYVTRISFATMEIAHQFDGVNNINILSDKWVIDYVADVYLKYDAHAVPYIAKFLANPIKELSIFDKLKQLSVLY